MKLKLDKKVYLPLIVILISVLFVACPKKADEDVDLPPDDTGTAVIGDEVIEDSGSDTARWKTGSDLDSEPSTGEIPKTSDEASFEIVYFDFDKYNLRPDAIAALQKNIAILKQNPSMRIVIEGHCDERGTNEYNMALGMRRANSCKNYLIANGIESSRVTIVSFGEERPADPGHNEAAWAKNRRAEFKVISK